MNSVISKNILSFISHSIVLAQMFVIILFFECYSIKFENQSLFDLTVNFDDIHLKPFFAFLYFIAVCRIVWVLLNLIKFTFNLYTIDLSTEFSSKVSFTAFLLLILCSYYFIILNDQPDLAPFYKKENTIFNKLYIMPFLLIIFGSTYITILGTINLSNSEKDS